MPPTHRIARSRRWLARVAAVLATAAPAIATAAGVAASAGCRTVNDVATGLGASAVVAAEPATEEHDLALQILAIERRWLGERIAGNPFSAGSGGAAAASRLATLLAAAEQRVRAGGDPGDQPPVAILLAIHSALAEAGITYGDSSPSRGADGGRARGRPFSEGLSEGRFDCAMYVWFYLAVAERCGLPLTAIGLPGHVALRWLVSDGGHLNWETTVPDLRDDADYLAWKQPSSEAVQQGVYLRNLDRNEVIAIAYYRVSQNLAARKELAAARAAAAQALALAPDFPDAHNLQGLILARYGSAEAALAHFDRAIALDPYFTQAYLNRANYRLDRGDFAGARSDLALWRQLERQPR